MSSPATVTEYGKFIDLQNYTAAAPEKSGSIYLSGSDASEKLHTNVGISAAGSVTAVGSFIIGSADMSEADLEKLDGITNGTVAANKAVVVDGNKDASGFRHVTSTGNVTAGGSFIIGSADMDETDLEKLDGITNGTAAANKALVLDADKAIGTITHLTATYAKIDVLDVNEINSVTRTETTLEVVDKLILAASGSASAAAAGGGLQIGGTGGSDTVASVLYDHANTALDFNIGGTTEMRLQDGVLRPETDNDVDLGASGAEFKDLYLDGVAYVDELRADQLGAALDANSQAITNINVDSGVIDNTVIGGNTAAAGTFTTLVAGGNVDLGDATSDTITATGRFDSDLVPSTDSARALGTSALQWSAVHVDVGHIDQLGSALDGNSQNVTGVGTFSAAGATVTSLSVSDGNITNVADIALDSISADGNDIDISLTDNRSAALEIKEGSNVYMSFDTTNSEEAIYFKKELEIEQGGVVYDDKQLQFATDLGDTGASGSLKYVAADDVFEISGSTANGLSFSGSANFNSYGIEAGQASFAATTVTSLSVTDGNITNVGDIALDSISADGNDIDIVMTDNRSAALEIKEGSNVYLQFETSNGSETIFAKKEFEFQAGANMDDDQKFKFATDEADTGASGSLGYISADDVFEISGSSANGLSFSGSANFNGYGLEAGAGSFTSLTVNDGNITNVGSLACDSVLVDDAAVGLDIRFGGNTTLNKLTLTDNLADALNINEGGNSYLKFVTTNGQEEIVAGKELTLNQGGLVADDQAMVFGDDDDGSIAFISAANVVRFDGGSAGLHFNDTSVFGADGSGKDVSFHGAAANELMKYTAADHTLKFTDSSGATHVTIGGDATSEFAVDVADGSNNKNKVRAAAFVTYSDERLKTDVSAIENGLETVNNLKAVNFTWKKDGSRDFGFMAQELKQVIPQAVHGSEEGLYGVDYGRLSAILVSAIQEQSAQIASLKEQLENK